MKQLSFLVIYLFFLQGMMAQSIIQGKIVDDDSGEGIPLVNIVTDPFIGGTTTNELGVFRLEVSTEDSVFCIISHVGYQDSKIWIKVSTRDLVIRLQRSLTELEGVSVQDSLSRNVGPSITRLEPKDFEYLPSAFDDFSKVLATLPGVIAVNELSSSYSVRGGNYDENLIFVNGIAIYKPLIIKAGRQEGLSFVNPDLVSSTSFSSGGWSSRYGDRLSSVLDVNYKKPTEFGGSVTLGLLGGSVHLEGKKSGVEYLVGIRHKNSEYLLNTLETDGSYLPRFTDIQAFVGYDGFKNGKSRLGLLLAYAQNRYRTIPENRESTFGTFDRQLRLFVAFDGRDGIEYDTYQGGVNFDHQFNEKFTSRTILSGVFSVERENLDLEGGYRLCDVETDITSDNFNNCVVIRAIGTNYNYARNKLDLGMVRFDQQFFYNPREGHEFEFGVGYNYENIEDVLNEYEFLDSADFITITPGSVLSTSNTVNSHRVYGYAQHGINWSGNRQRIEYGLRWSYWSFNKEFFVNPRFSYSFTPNSNLTWNAAVGLYYQPPFYRDARTPEGDFSSDILSQKSIHAIVGSNYDFMMWGRPFKFVSELYYKYMWDVNPYDVDNVRIRYFGNNDATAYAYGADFRISGEFIQGAESWFSLGLLSTQEDVEEDDKGYIRRPSDQRVTVGIFFQDHIPDNPSIRVYLNLLFGTGLPFSPPQNINSRGAFIGESYNRVDIGFSKIITFQNRFKSLWLGLEVLNLFGVDNTISYTWITDLTNQQLAVPNSLSQRYFNLKAQLKF